MIIILEAYPEETQARNASLYNLNASHTVPPTMGSFLAGRGGWRVQSLQLISIYLKLMPSTKST